MGGGSNLSISLADGVELLVHGGGESGPGPLSVEMRKGGGEPTVVFNLDVNARLVSRNAYHRTFPDSK